MSKLFGTDVQNGLFTQTQATVIFGKRFNETTEFSLGNTAKTTILACVVNEGGGRLIGVQNPSATIIHTGTHIATAPFRLGKRLFSAAFNKAKAMNSNP